MIRIVRTGGKQYLVKPGQELKVEKLSADPGAALEIEVLLRSDQEESDSPSVEIGTPLLSTKAAATLVEQGRGKKIAVVKYKRKVRYRRRTGHRQDLSKIKLS